MYRAVSRALRPIAAYVSPDRRADLRVVLAVLVLGTTVPLVLFAALLVRDAWRDHRTVVDRQNVDTARAIMVAVDKEVERAEAALQVLASLEALNEPDLTRFERIALRLLPTQPGWHSLLVLSPAGEILFNSARHPGERLARREYAWLPRVVSTRRAVASDLFQSAAGEHLFTIAMPVLRSNTPVLVLAAQIRAASLGDVLRRQNTPPGGVVTLLDGSRVIMARTRGEAEYVGGPPSAGFQAASARMREGSWQETLLEGTPAYGALSRSAITGWTVGIGVSVDEVDGPVRRSFWLLSAAGAAILAVGLVVALALGRHIVGALGRAAGAAQALARGQPVTAPSSRITEFHALGTAMLEAGAILDTRLRERDEALAAERAARAASEAHEARLEVTLQSIGDAVVTTDAGGRVAMLNTVAQALTGWTQDAAKGRPIETVLQIVDEATGQTVENPVSAVLRRGDSRSLPNQSVLRTHDGRELPIEDSAAPIRDGEGALIGVVLVFRDVTAQRRAEQERQALFEREQAARHQAETVSRDKDEFVATVSHELRTPLNAIFGWVRLLRDGKLDEAGRARAVEVLDRNTRMQAQLIDDLLDMSRAITGHLSLEARRMELGPVLEAALDVVRPAAQAKGIELVLDAHAKTFVSGDPGRLQQVVWNLLANSVRFTQPGGRIVLTLSIAGAEAVIEVRDDGAGIDASLLPHVFERFRRGAPGSEGGGGLGIGLALVRHLVELHGGTAAAASDGPGRGATFTIRLPLLSSGSASVLTAQPSVDTPDRALDGRRVLVVDDDDDARELIAEILRQAGADVVQAGSVAAALEAVAAHDPDAVVSDIAMPHATGYDLVRQLRALPRTAGLPTIALTAHSWREHRERALAAGFDEHVGKPFDPARLVAVTAKLLADR